MMRETMARCEACAAPVGDDRVLCPQCGVDVDDLSAPVVWPQPFTAFVPIRQAPKIRRRGRRMGLVVALILAIIVGALVPRGMFSDDPLVPAMPAAQQAASDELSLEIAAIGTVRLSGQTDNSDVLNVLRDENRDTAWFGEAPTLGFVAREQILVRFDEAAWVSRVVIANGVHADLAAYDAHGRIRTLELLFDGGVTHTATLFDIGRLRQQILLPTPVLTTSARVTILSVYPGQEHRDVAISELDLRGYTATSAQQQVAAEQARLSPAVDQTQS